jgi:hypothetical protein
VTEVRFTTAALYVAAIAAFAAAIGLGIAGHLP